MTPTIVMLDSAGVITDLIEERLSANTESALFRRLTGDRREPIRVGQSLTEVFLTENPEFQVGPQLIDIRDRATFQRAPTSATNIPADEPTARGPAELALSQPVYIDCRHSPQMDCRFAGMDLENAGFQRVIIVLQ